MATTSDTQRAAIGERKRQAQHALRERHQRQEAAHTAVFAALDRLAHQLDRANTTIADSATDPLERATTITTIADQLTTDIAAVRAAATDLADTTGMSNDEVANLLGTSPTLLFPRRRNTTTRPPNQSAADPVDPSSATAR